MNPCPCGYAGHLQDRCLCTQEQIQRYRGKISGPLLDRMDMHVEVTRQSSELLSDTVSPSAETSLIVRERVLRARKIQEQRQGKCNSLLTIPELDEACVLETNAQQLLHQVMSKFDLSARVYHRIVKVARTVADLEGCESILERHISEVLNYRCLDRKQGYN